MPAEFWVYIERVGVIVLLTTALYGHYRGWWFTAAAMNGAIKRYEQGLAERDKTITDLRAELKDAIQELRDGDRQALAVAQQALSAAQQSEAVMRELLARTDGPG